MFRTEARGELSSEPSCCSFQSNRTGIVRCGKKCEISIPNAKQIALCFNIFCHFWTNDSSYNSSHPIAECLPSKKIVICISDSHTIQMWCNSQKHTCACQLDVSMYCLIGISRTWLFDICNLMCSINNVLYVSTYYTRCFK